MRLGPSEAFTLVKRRKGVIAILNRNGKTNNDGSFDWTDAVIDAGIMAMLTFFTSLGGMAITDVLKGATAVAASAISAAMEFFVILAIKRGLKK